VTAAPVAQVWRRYADVAAWPEWMVGVESAALDGPFAAGACGRLIPAGRAPVPLRIVSVAAPLGYVSETELVPGAALRIEHELQELPAGGTRITHRANVPRAVLDAYGLDFAPVLYDGMRRTIEALARTTTEAQGSAPAVPHVVRPGPAGSP
jgi:Polyketide cyclase / dehydrase and lipid transport